MEELSLNSTGHCIICLKKQEENAEIISKNSLQFKHHHLHQLFAHLKVLSKVSKLSKVLTQPKSPLKGLLCTNCSKFYSKLIELFLILEKTRLELDFTLGQLKSVLEETNQNSYRIGQFKQSMRKEKESKASLEIVEELRNVLLKGCEEQARLNPSPEVRVSQLEITPEVGGSKSVKNDDETPVACFMLDLPPVEKVIRKRQRKERKDTPRAIVRAQWRILYQRHCKKVGDFKWTCTACTGKYFKCKKSFCNHYKSTHLKRTFPCGKGECQMIYRDLNNLRRHRSKCNGKLPPPKPTEFECPDCKRKFPRRHPMMYHRRLVHLKIRDEVCDFCKRTFKSRQYLQRHCEAVHLQLRYYCEEPGCDKFYTKKETLQVHVAKVHILGKRIENKFGIKKNIQDEVKAVQSQDSKSNSDIPMEDEEPVPPKLLPPSEIVVDDSMPNLPPPLSPNLPIIISTVAVTEAEAIPVVKESITVKVEAEEEESHGDDPDWTVDDLISAPKSSKSATQFDHRFRSGENYFIHAEFSESGLKCKLCGRMYRYRGGFGEHYKAAHQGRRFPCVVGKCEKQFTTQSRVRDHQVNCKGLPPREKLTAFTCDICGTKFAREALLRYHHKLVHLDVRNHPCDMCDKRFKQPNALKRHKRSVHFQEKVKCTYDGCDKAYGRSDMLALHVARDHLGYRT